MLSRDIIDAITQGFCDKFDPVCQKSIDFIRATEEISHFVVGNNHFTKEQQGDFEDSLSHVISAVSMLAYYVGIGDGVDMLSSLARPDFMDRVLEVTQDKYRKVI